MEVKPASAEVAGSGGAACDTVSIHSDEQPETVEIKSDSDVEHLIQMDRWPQYFNSYKSLSEGNEVTR